MPVDCIVILRSQRTNMLFYFWIDLGESRQGAKLITDPARASSGRIFIVSNDRTSSRFSA
jgi:hypothetical protein